MLSYKPKHDNAIRFLDTPDLFNAKVSSNGRWAVWTWTNKDNYRNVYAANLHSGTVIRVTNDTTNYDICGWSSAGSLLVIAAEQSNGALELYVAEPTENAPLFPLVQQPEKFHLVQGEYNEQTKVVYFSAAHIAANAHLPTFSIFSKNIIDKETSELKNLPASLLQYLSLNQNGEWLLYCVLDLEKQEKALRLLKVDGSYEQEIIRSSSNSLLRATWHSEGKQIILVCDDDTKTYRRLGIYSLETRLLSWLLDTPRQWIEYAFSPTNSPLVCVNEIRQGLSVCSLLDINTGETQDVKVENLQVTPTGYVTENDAWVLLAYSSQQPTDLILARQKNNKTYSPLNSITNFWSTVNFTNCEVFPALPISWCSVDNLTIHGYLYRNPQLNRGTIVMLHGGPHEVALNRFQPWIQFLVSYGYCVLEPNFRGSTGYGLPFQEAIYQDGWGGLEQQDIRYGILALLERDISRRGRIAVMGASFGGFSALCQSSFVSSEYIDATITINGICDLALDYHSAHAVLQSQLVRAMGGRPHEVPDKYRSRSPLTYAGNIRGDVMIVTGLLDGNVNPLNCLALASVLKRHGKRVKHITFADEGHLIQKKENVAKLLQEIEAFLSVAFYRSYNELGT
jgi:dipeptidyl aminopeptidase/acylaminoacyl peptidase